MAFEMLDGRSRLTFLTKLSERFCPSDRWQLQQILYSQNSYFDIVGNLPIELATQVLSYLEPREIIPYRRVGRRWHGLLTADSVCSALLRKWYPKEATVCEEEDQRSWRRMFENEVSRERAVRSPHLCERIQMPLEHVNPFAKVASVMGQRLALLATDHRSFEIWQLGPGLGHRIVGGLAVPARTTLNWVRLLDDYVMVSGDDAAQIWVWQIGNFESHMFRLPNAERIVEADGNLAVFAWRGGMLLYDAPTRNMVSLGDSENCDAVYIDARTQKVSLLNNHLPSIKTYSIVTGELLQEISGWFREPVDQGAIPVHRGGRCAENLHIIGHLWGHPQRWAGAGNSEDGISTHATIFDSRACRIMYQHLWFKGIRELPKKVYMFDGTIHALLRDCSGIAIATHVPMVTGVNGNSGSFFEVNFTIVRSEEWGFDDRTAYMFPMLAIPPDKAVFMTSKYPFILTMIVYKGIHELEEGKEEVGGVKEEPDEAPPWQKGPEIMRMVT